MLTIIGLIIFFIIRKPISFLFITPTLIVDLFWLIFTIYWFSNTCKGSPKLTFRQFINIYNAIPEHFYLKESYVTYIGGSHRHRVDVDFATPLSLLKYKIFYLRKDAYESRMKEMGAQAEFIESLQKDLGEKREEINKFIKEKVNYEEN